MHALQMIFHCHKGGKEVFHRCTTEAMHIIIIFLGFVRCSWKYFLSMWACYKIGHVGILIAR